MRIDAKMPTPKYLQLKDIIKQYFKNEPYEAGQKIPSENDLINQFHVSRNTVRQALAELVNEGFIYKKRGSGSFFSGKTRENRQHSYLIGVITPNISSYIYPQIIQGIDDIAHKNRYNIVLGSSKGSHEKELACFEQLLEKHIEGLLFEPFGGFRDIQDSKIFRLLKELTIPFVFMNWAIDDPEVSYVSPDDIEGGFKATSYLAEAGHQRIACVYPEDHIPGIQRYQGYRRALEAYRINYDNKLDKPTTIFKWNNPDHLSMLMRELINLGDEMPSAIFFFNDEAALRGYLAIREAGLTIPDDISIVGFDASEPAALAEVPLTSVMHPKYQIGKWAAEILFEDIKSRGPKMSKHMIIKPKIAIRASVKFLKNEGA
jgi:GntR family transcriptional regulator of arabinose operon